MKNRTEVALLQKIKQSTLLRQIGKPYMDYKRKKGLEKYAASEDSTFLKAYKNKYDGKRCFIIGNGPSLTASDLELLKNEICFGSNYIYNIYSKTEWRPTFYLCIDTQRIHECIESIKKLEGSIKFVSFAANQYGREEKDGIHYLYIYGPFIPRLEKRIPKSINEDLANYVSEWQNVTCLALEMAFYMGFKDIYLLGVDHSYPIMIDKTGKKVVDTSVQSHFSGGGSPNSSAQFLYYDATNECFELCKKYANTHGINVFNATRGGKLEIFNRIDLEKVIE